MRDKLTFSVFKIPGLVVFLFSQCCVHVLSLGGVAAGVISDRTGGRASICLVMLFLAAPMVCIFYLFILFIYYFSFKTVSH